MRVFECECACSSANARVWVRMRVFECECACSSANARAQTWFKAVCIWAVCVWAIHYACTYVLACMHVEVWGGHLCIKCFAFESARQKTMQYNSHLQVKYFGKTSYAMSANRRIASLCFLPGHFKCKSLYVWKSYVSMYLCMYICMYVGMYVCTCVCMYTCMYVWCMHIWSYTCIYA